jgi:sortase A
VTLWIPPEWVSSAGGDGGQPDRGTGDEPPEPGAPGAQDPGARNADSVDEATTVLPLAPDPLADSPLADSPLADEPLANRKPDGTAEKPEPKPAAKPVEARPSLFQPRRLAAPPGTNSRDTLDPPTEIIRLPKAAKPAESNQPSETPQRERPAAPETPTEKRPVAAGQEPFQEDPTVVIGPIGIGRWMLQDGDSGNDAGNAVARARRDLTRSARRGYTVPEEAHPPVGAAKATTRPPTRGDRVRTAVRGFGQTLITVGLVILLFVVYEVWFTNIQNGRTQKHLRHKLEQQWDQGDDPLVGKAQRPGQKVRSIPLGSGFALIYIPAFGTDYVYTIVEGTGAAQLDEGPGHYTDTALPGQVGNMSVAGHRVGKGSPFLNLDKLPAGAAIVIRTKGFWYTYRVLGDRRTGNAEARDRFGIPGREIVSPLDVTVVAAVPGQPGARPTRRLLTLTTCHPKFSARKRLIIHAELEGKPYPTSRGLPPALAG